MAIVLGALLSSAALVLAGQPFVLLAQGFLALHIPVALIEGLVTGSVVVLLRQVRPEVLRASVLVPMAREVGDG
jgi:cobalt/nickel transport system permease protein